MIRPPNTCKNSADGANSQNTILLGKLMVDGAFWMSHYLKDCAEIILQFWVDSVFGEKQQQKKRKVWLALMKIPVDVTNARPRSGNNSEFGLQGQNEVKWRNCTSGCLEDKSRTQWVRRKITTQKSVQMLVPIRKLMIGALQNEDSERAHWLCDRHGDRVSAAGRHGRPVRHVPFPRHWSRVLTTIASHWVTNGTAHAWVASFCVLTGHSLFAQWNQNRRHGHHHLQVRRFHITVGHYNPLSQNTDKCWCFESSCFLLRSVWVRFVHITVGGGGICHNCNHFPVLWFANWVMLKQYSCKPVDFWS